MLILNSSLNRLIIAVFTLAVWSFTAIAKETDTVLDDKYKQAVMTEKTAPHSTFPIYQNLVEQGHTEAKVRLAALLIAGLGNTNRTARTEEAFSLLEDAADQGSINAYYGLSVLYNGGGVGIPVNKKLGMQWLSKAANAGEPRAQTQLGYHYQYEVFIERDITKAIYWYKKAIKQDSDSARYHLGKIYRDGSPGIPQNLFKAVQLLTAAAGLPGGDAKVALGNIYYDNEYSLKDGKKAFYWLNSAAQDGNAYGQTGLASCYLYGIGTEVNYKKALNLYQKSVEATQAPTPRYRLAEMYMLGLGTKVNLAKAREIFLSLSQDGYEDGTTAVAQIDELLAKAK